GLHANLEYQSGHLRQSTRCGGSSPGSAFGGEPTGLAWGRLSLSREGTISAQVRIGTSGWHYKHWKGCFYPPELKSSQYLSWYIRHFNTVEINNCFYRLPTASAVENWHKETPPGFCFAVKASRFSRISSGFAKLSRLSQPTWTEWKSWGKSLDPSCSSFTQTGTSTWNDCRSFCNCCHGGGTHTSSNSAIRPGMWTRSIASFVNTASRYVSTTGEGRLLPRNLPPTLPT